MQRARVLAENIGSPDRATQAYEKVLEMQPEHAGALEALARLRERSGDAHAALIGHRGAGGQGDNARGARRSSGSVRRVCSRARGDQDGAIERYKLALEANPRGHDGVGGAAAARTRSGATPTSVVALIEKRARARRGEDGQGAPLRASSRASSARSSTTTTRPRRTRRTAIDLDPTNADALLVLGDIAFEQERYVEASKHLESLVGRATALAKEDAVRVLVRYVEAYGRAT